MMPEATSHGAAPETLRIPPHAIASEQAVLGALMLAPDRLAQVSDWLSEDDFYRADHRLIYRAICGLIERKAAVDAVTLADWMENSGLSEYIPSPNYLIELANETPSAANLVSHAEIVVERARLRMLIGAGTELTEAAWSRGADAGQITAQAMHALSQLQVSKLRGGLVPAKASLQSMYTGMVQRLESGATLIGEPWPWKDLNDITKGLQDGVLYILGGRPSMGKSVMGLQVAAFAALRGLRSALFSVEMSAEECMRRMAACIAEIPHSWIETPSNDHPDADWFWPRLTRAMEHLLAAPLLIDETPALTVEQWAARARRAHLQSPVRLIVLDHMHDMTLDPKREVRSELGRVAQVGKTLAKELKCPVLVLAQLNRASTQRVNKRPTLADLRESGELEQKADVVLFIHREEEYDPETHLKGAAEIIVAKGRNMRRKDVLLQWIGAEMRLADWIGEWPVPSIPEGVTHKRRGGFRASPRSADD